MLEMFRRWWRRRRLKRFLFEPESWERDLADVIADTVVALLKEDEDKNGNT